MGRTRKQGRKRINVSVSPALHERSQKICSRLGYKTPASMCAKLLEIVTASDLVETIPGTHTGEDITGEVQNMFDDYASWDEHSGKAYLGRIIRRL